MKNEDLLPQVLPASPAGWHWYNPPQQYAVNAAENSLIIFPDARTDFWQRTHYGFAPDNGHFLFTEVPGDFILSTEVFFIPRHQYDQAGLMVRFSSNCWLKTSVEYEPDGPAKLGAVVTNLGYSDWSTQIFPFTRNQIRLRISRTSGDYLVEYLGETGRWVQMRLAHLMEDTGQAPIQCGIYACSPIDKGYEARFSQIQFS
jgi:uncharacterized protein